VPAAFCGLYCLKPTSDRLTSAGVGIPNKSKQGDCGVLPPVAGPIGCSVDDCIIGFKVQADPDVKQIDENCEPTFWNEQNFT
jgi:Asp-tRNA(Asn)/Glu-tRNA(Gln) amidotransferase A subunit family amidase